MAVGASGVDSPVIRSLAGDCVPICHEEDGRLKERRVATRNISSLVGPLKDEVSRKRWYLLTSLSSRQ